MSINGKASMKKLSAALTVTALFAVGNAQASITTVSTQGAFSGLGTITQNTNFDGYSSSWTYPGSPFNVGDLTFVQGQQNLIGGQSGYGLARNVLLDNHGSGTTVLTAGNHGLLGFNAANLGQAGSITFELVTNLGAYSYLEAIPKGSTGFKFLGFMAGAGEYFTSLRFGASGNSGVWTGVTDVQLGNVSPVPEPETYAMLLAGFGLMAGIARRRKKQLAA
jgi:hypothetical protein